MRPAISVMRIFDKVRCDFASVFKVHIDLALACRRNLCRGQNSYAVSEIWEMYEETSIFFKTYLKRFGAKLANLDHANNAFRENRSDILRLKSLHISYPSPRFMKRGSLFVSILKEST